MIAVQGPQALETLQPLFDQPLEPVRYYHLTMGRLLGPVDTVISRTGYTGEDGFEVIVGARRRDGFWEALLESGKPHGISRCGLGARDTLRLEAGMPLYGHELSEDDRTRTPPAWAGPSSSTRANSSAETPCSTRKRRPGLTRVGLMLEASGSPARVRSCSRANGRSARSPRARSRRP